MQTTGATGRAGRVRVEECRKRDRAAEDGALRYPDSPIEELRGLIRLDWDARSPSCRTAWRSA